ncbi:hypothetical protein C1645_829437 [Glomus cerebriforme]|uniref:Uncharacterized protein n=1 Tax=Glomus cerebriforme TaxID=658196 RepID=A0A397SQN3_9GLOM|nr:hypothetical protein C1645_829437 [Glomus cerebriforme]
MARNILFLFRLFVFLMCIFQVFGHTSPDLPDGWFSAGDSPNDYLMGVDHTIFYGRAPGSSGFIKALPSANDKGFGTMMQNFFPKKFIGKRVRLSCFVKHENVLGWAGMWMRVDTIMENVLDNMFDRKITGTGDWVKFESVLDVPKDTINLAFGILLSGAGEAWLDNCKFEIVDSSVSTTATTPKKLDHPINLSFQS